MAVSWMQLLHNTALRMNALTGTTAALLETTYATGTLTAAEFKSADFPFSSFRDTILMAVAEYAEAIASVGNHPWRSNFAGVTSALADGVVVPATDSGGVKIIGVYGEVVDGTDGKPLSEQPLEAVRRFKAETWRVYPLYHYKFDGRRIFHTRSTVVIGVCIYDRGAQLTSWNAAGNMPLPDSLEMAASARAISLMVKDNAFEAQAKLYREYSNDQLQLIYKGLTSVPAKSLPSPTQLSTAA